MNSSIKDHAPKDLTIITLNDPLYHYARVISNTRFGHMPSAVAYCETNEHVAYCIKFCTKNGVNFRVRSGGHQHEGMSSGNSVVIIDLSKMNTIDYDKDHADIAWIPVGKQLAKVYEELEIRHQIIPGGGCQSVNIGGITQGGGWGPSIRKHGLTCDSVLACEIVLATGETVIATATEYPDLFWALKGGGGGNFGVVTRFKFKLSSILPVVTSFALQWTKEEDVKAVMKIWTNLHAEMDVLDPALSTACGMVVAKKDKHGKNPVHARMGGMFYGSKVMLLSILDTHFGKLIPTNLDDFVTLKENPKGYSEKDHSMLENEASNSFSLAVHQSFISDFVNPTLDINDPTEILIATNEREGYRVLPNAPSSTCDKPHPHKVTSSFPKKDVNHDALVLKIYDFLAETPFYKDVNRYMSFHCLGGAVTKNADKRVFAFHNKPYMFQIQAWWDDAGNPFTNESRNIEYVAWVKAFREEIAPETEGAFINFVDRSLVEDIENDENRLKLLEIYYGKGNLEKLRTIKTKYDPTQVFNFEMSILPK